MLRFPGKNDQRLSRKTDEISAKWQSASVTRQTMTGISAVDELVGQALEILDAFGIPFEGMTKLRKRRMAKAFVAVAGLRPGLSWKDAIASAQKYRPRSREVISWMNQHLGENISSGSYDDVRRKDLVLLSEAGIVLKAAGNEGAAPNDGTRGYAISPGFAVQIRKFGTPGWGASLPGFMANKQTLADALRRERRLAMLPVKIGDVDVVLGPGKHNQLQKAVIEQFLPRFGHGAEVLYVGDATDKFLFLNAERLSELNFFEIAHDKLPDVLAFSSEKNWLYLIEAVHSANPITPLRKRNQEQLTKGCTAEIVFITAFLDHASYRKFSGSIAWETEVWMADAPDHMLHLNGHNFMGPHSGAKSN